MIKKGNRFSAAVLPYVLHSFFKNLISVAPERSVVRIKSTELNTSLESPDIHCALVGHSFVTWG